MRTSLRDPSDLEAFANYHAAKALTGLVSDPCWVVVPENEGTLPLVRYLFREVSTELGMRFFSGDMRALHGGTVTIFGYKTLSTTTDFTPTPRTQFAPEVQPFLKEHRFLQGVLSEAIQKLAEIFGRDAGYHVDLPIDPNEPEQRSLLLSVSTPLSSEDAITALEKFICEWWIEQPYSVRRLITVTTTPR